MRLLFLHPNFPGQFVRPALMAGQRGDDVKFLCQTHFGRELQGVERITMKDGLGQEKLKNFNKKGLLKTLYLANQYRRAMEQLKSSGWEPDIIISHSGFGCGLHSSYIWPNAKKISYLEWWFANKSPVTSFDPHNKWWSGPDNTTTTRERNMPLALELSESDIIVSPTEWQKSQLPNLFEKNCLVIHDGVDRKRFNAESDTIKNITPLLTYGTRGLEAMRGFPEFIEELPNILHHNKTISVEIAGEDQICYGGNAPKEGSYKQWAKGFLAEWVKDGRVKFIGRLEPKQYETWLQRSWFHVHLTRPFVASWSLVEAMSSGCCLIASDTEPVREFVDNNSGILVDFRKPGWLSNPIQLLINSKKLRSKLGQNARSRSEKWSEQHSFVQWDMLLRN